MKESSADKEAVEETGEFFERLNSGAKTLCMPLAQDPMPDGQACFHCGKPVTKWCLFGRSY